MPRPHKHKPPTDFGRWITPLAVIFVMSFFILFAVALRSFFFATPSPTPQTPYVTLDAQRLGPGGTKLAQSIEGRVKTPPAAAFMIIMPNLSTAITDKTQQYPIEVHVTITPETQFYRSFKKSPAELQRETELLPPGMNPPSPIDSTKITLADIKKGEYVRIVWRYELFNRATEERIIKADQINIAEDSPFFSTSRVISP